MKKVDVKYVKWLDKERRKINSIPLKDIIWTSSGKKLHIPQEIVEHFGLTGLNNCDFITSGYYTLMIIKGNIKE